MTLPVISVTVMTVVMSMMTEKGIDDRKGDGGRGEGGGRAGAKCETRESVSSGLHAFTARLHSIKSFTLTGTGKTSLVGGTR